MVKRPCFPYCSTAIYDEADRLSSQPSEKSVNDLLTLHLLGSLMGFHPLMPTGRSKKRESRNIDDK